MAKLSFDSNGTAKTATELTAQTDSSLLIVDGEHVFDAPSTILINRVLPTQERYRKNGISRRRDVVVDAGTANERIATAYVKLTESADPAFPEDILQEMRDDVAGVSVTPMMDELHENGVIDLNPVSAG
jgi:hypothetical protein